MKNSQHKTLEIVGYLVLALVIPIIAVSIRQQFPPPLPEMTIKHIAWSIALGLLFSGLPGLVPFYLFRKWQTGRRLIAPAAALLLEASWFLLFFLGQIHGFIWVVAMFFPVVGIAIATILTARLPRLRQNNPSIMLDQLAVAVFVELLLGVFLPITVLTCHQ